jgi:3-ketosteroid 9alpha-monooxygenase subunit B
VATTDPRRKLRTFEVMVSRVSWHTPDTVSLVFFTGNERLDYKAGQFLTIDPHQFPQLAHFTAFLEDLKKRKEQPRAYSLSSAPHEPFVAITFKQERYISGDTPYPPLLSPLLAMQSPVGTRLQVSGFTGAYVLPADVEDQTDHIVHLVAGSGVVPNFSILKEDLRSGHKLRHTVLFSNRTWADICFRDELSRLQRDHPERLQIVHTLTRERDPALLRGQVRQGRLSAELISEFVPDPGSALFYVCGPAISAWERRQALESRTQAQPRFLEATLGHLQTLGVDTRRVKRESWG